MRKKLLVWQFYANFNKYLSLLKRRKTEGIFDEIIGIFGQSIHKFNIFVIYRNIRFL